MYVVIFNCELLIPSIKIAIQWLDAVGHEDVNPNVNVNVNVNVCLSKHDKRNSLVITAWSEHYPGNKPTRINIVFARRIGSAAY
jgi:hypothetical protein